MRIKGDSIVQPKAVVDGTENKIEDVINKLPGLEVMLMVKFSIKERRLIMY
jgi:hypothetical protein